MGPEAVYTFKRVLLMGFNFVAGHPSTVLGEGHPLEAMLIARFGRDVPIGSPGDDFCLQDELAWSWWSELQTFVLSQLGPNGSTHLRAVDAWSGAYLDLNVSREVLWMPGDEPRGGALSAPAKKGEAGGVLAWVKKLFGLKQKGPTAAAEESEVYVAIREMVEQYGARRGEENAFQVGNLRGLMGELNQLLTAIKVEPTEEAVESLLADTVSEDGPESRPHIQCLCHVWLTGNQALRMGAPLWLLK